MKTNLRISSIISSVLIGIAMLSCTTQQPVEQEKKDSLEGVWELVAGEWTLQDTLLKFPSSDTPDMKSYKFLFGKHWAVVGQVPSSELHWAHAGIYRITGDTYVEYFEIHNNIEAVGDSAVLKYALDDDKWTVSTDWMKEEWKRIE